MRFFSEYPSTFFADWFGASGPIYPAWVNVQHGGSGGTIRKLEKQKRELIKKQSRLEKRIEKKPEFDWTPSIMALREELARVEWELEETKRIIAERKKRQRAEDEMMLLLTY